MNILLPKLKILFTQVKRRRSPETIAPVAPLVQTPKPSRLSLTIVDRNLKIKPPPVSGPLRRYKSKNVLVNNSWTYKSETTRFPKKKNWIKNYFVTVEILRYVRRYVRCLGENSVRLPCRKNWRKPNGFINIQLAPKGHVNNLVKN